MKKTLGIICEGVSLIFAFAAFTIMFIFAKDSDSYKSKEDKNFYKFT